MRYKRTTPLHIDIYIDKVTSTITKCTSTCTKFTSTFTKLTFTFTTFTSTLTKVMPIQCRGEAEWGYKYPFLLSSFFNWIWIYWHKTSLYEIIIAKLKEEWLTRRKMYSGQILYVKKFSTYLGNLGASYIPEIKNRDMKQISALNSHSYIIMYTRKYVNVNYIPKSW